MSFDQLSSLESGRRGNSSYTDDPDFQRLSQQLNNKLFKLQGNISNLNRDIGHLGTKQDNARVRERVHELLEETRDAFKEVGEGVKKVQAWEDVTPTQRYTQQKLFREFQASFSEFQTLQRQALEKQKASVSAARAAQDDESGRPGGGDPSSDQQQQLQAQEQVSGFAVQD